LAEFAVSLIEIPRERLRRRGLVAAAHAHDDREEIGVDFTGVEKRSLRDRDARPGLRLIASADEIVVRRRRVLRRSKPLAIVVGGRVSPEISGTTPCKANCPCTSAGDAESNSSSSLQKIRSDEVTTHSQ
jgi:hypothetical protein